MPRIIGAVAPEFEQQASDVLQEMVTTAVPAVRELMLRTAWELHDAPSEQQLAMLHLKPSPNQVLLGLFTDPPPTIALFGRNIALVANRDGVTLRQKTREVAIHELAQHRFGLNHVHEESAWARALQPPDQLPAEVTAADFAPAPGN